MPWWRVISIIGGGACFVCPRAAESTSSTVAHACMLRGHIISIIQGEACFACPGVALRASLRVGPALHALEPHSQHHCGWGLLGLSWGHIISIVVGPALHGPGSLKVLLCVSWGILVGSVSSAHGLGRLTWRGILQAEAFISCSWVRGVKCGRLHVTNVSELSPVALSYSRVQRREGLRTP